MARTIILENCEHEILTVDIPNENVTVPFKLLDADGKTWMIGTAIFWREIPELRDPEGNLLPTPEEWFQIPLAYLQDLADMTNDIHTALVSRFLT